jgi:hypothetical protein
MRVKRNNGGEVAGCVGTFLYEPQDFLVPEVQPVKISDRNCGAPRARRMRGPILDAIADEKSHQT